MNIDTERLDLVLFKQSWIMDKHLLVGELARKKTLYFPKGTTVMCLMFPRRHKLKHTFTQNKKIPKLEQIKPRYVG